MCMWAVVSRNWHPGRNHCTHPIHGELPIEMQRWGKFLTDFIFRTLSQMVVVMDSGTYDGQLCKIRVCESRGMMHHGWGSATGSLDSLSCSCGKAEYWKDVVWDPGEGNQCFDAPDYGMTRMHRGVEMTAQWNMLGRCKAEPKELERFSHLGKQKVKI
ncbi:hypothetical protein GOP47_0029553 [Adiantum capillus-veneris]|nr:hypothetical protein GOP47_0029553 [Adiantum capillus-veneris]